MNRSCHGRQLLQIVGGSILSLLIATQAGAQTEGPPPTPAPTRAFLVPIDMVPARVRTDLGWQRTWLRGQILFALTRSDSSGALALTLRDANLLGTPVPTSRGSTGLHSLTLQGQEPLSVTLDPATGSAAAAMRLYGHYPLIDRIVGTRKVSNDQWAPFTEPFNGELRGRFSSSPVPGSPVTFSGFLRLRLGGTVVGAIGEIELAIGRTPIEWLPPPCDGAFGFFRTLALQPIFVRIGPDDAWPTGRSFDQLVAQAETVWNKACVSFTVHPPLYINNADLKVLDAPNEDVTLRDARARVPGAVEVYVVAEMPLFGGTAFTAGSGTASAWTVVSDDTLTRDPPSLNVLAHELGHVMGFCHPEDEEEACRPDNQVVLVPGSPGTVMESSGAEADNPDLQSLDNCRNVSNSLLVYRRLFCCFRPDCVDDCR